MEAAVRVLLVAAIAWMLIALTRVLDDVVARRFDVTAADNLRARRVRTQVGLLRRVLVFAIVLLAVGAVFMQFEGFRALGAGLLASAGVAGIVFGIAAQRPLGNIVAGVQLALSQPIRVGDAVVMENEWGTVEEITLSYVVVRIWDQRRLVLPISYFFERPFQNWTRTSAQIVGSVFLWVDYSAPVDVIRAEHERIVRDSRFWDGQVCALHVTDSSDRALQLRATMSAADAGRAWDLRCEVREKLVAFLRRSYPETLPRLRVVDVADVATRDHDASVATDGRAGPDAGIAAPNSDLPAGLGRDDARR
jgi:small-conductance mechanosensitive channel